MCEVFNVGGPKIGRIPIIILVMIVAGLMAVTGCQSSTEPVSTVTKAVTEGDLAPDFKLQDLDGETVSLSDMRGRPVLLNFWATWCPPCRAEMPYLQQVFEEWQGKELAVLTIDIGESRSTVQNYLQSYRLSLPVLLDIKKTVAYKYGFRYVPTTFFIDRDGIIQRMRVGPFPSKEAIDDYIDTIIP
jgi:thiol-disulfide isomerase/thioredoxin